MSVSQLRLVPSKDHTEGDIEMEWRVGCLVHHD